jgi:predicted PurR-regulated permease PerM
MPSFASGILPIFEIGFLVPFIAFFLMREGHVLRDTLLSWIPSRYIEMALNILVEVDNSLGKYVRGLCLEAFCVGAMALAGFSIIHLDYALQIALVIGLANVVPCMAKVLLQVLWSWYLSQYGLRPSMPLPEISRIPLI